MASELPHLATIPGGMQLLVKGKPFLMLPAELQNSSLSSADHMHDIWPKLAAQHINTVLGAVTWEQIEPREGRFNLSELDKVIKDARENGLHLVLLWFGSFKNGLSTYCPKWVKTDGKRFPRMRILNREGKLQLADVISPFYEEAVKADMNAFTTLMKHLKEIDQHHNTVIMVQVENEVGVLGDSRDRSRAAQKAFESHVPTELIRGLDQGWDGLHDQLKANLQHNFQRGAQEAQSWEKTFGSGKHTDELFMAYHYARYLEKVAAAGKAVYPLPLYTNVWMKSDMASGPVSGGQIPGEYPSGGGVPPVLDVWQLFAPSIDFISPDIYHADYRKACEDYTHRDQPLFIPEQRRDEYGARRMWLAYGSYRALGCSPFGIDTLKSDENPFGRHFGLLESVSAYVLAAHRRPGSIIGFFFDEPPEAGGVDATPPVSVKMGKWNLTIDKSFVFGRQGPGYGMVIQIGDTRFLLVGEGFCVKFSKDEKPTANPSLTGILSFTEKQVVNVETGELRDVRLLNGDETRGGRVAVMPAADPDYAGYPVAVTVPAGTRIAQVEVYALEMDEEEDE